MILWVSKDVWGTSEKSWYKLPTPTTKLSEIREDKGTDKEWIKPISSTIIVKWFKTGDLAQKIVNYAWKVSNGDLDFLMTLKAENGWFDMYKQSNCYQNGKREDSYWLCMIHRRWHSDIVDQKIFWESWEYQVEQCWKLYKGWTKFYGYNVREKYRNQFTILPN